MSEQSAVPKGFRLRKNGRGVEEYSIHFLTTGEASFARGTAATTLCNRIAEGPETFTREREQVTCARCRRILKGKATGADLSGVMKPPPKPKKEDERQLELFKPSPADR